MERFQFYENKSNNFNNCNFFLKKVIKVYWKNIYKFNKILLLFFLLIYRRKLYCLISLVHLRAKA